VAVALAGAPVVGATVVAATHWPEAGLAPAVAAGFLDSMFWFAFAMTVAFGAFGGLVYELLLRQGTLELPHRVTTQAEMAQHTHAPAHTLIKVGTLGRGVVGATAAVIVISIVPVGTPHAAAAVALTAGAAAPTLIRLVRKHLIVVTGNVLGP
jgi:hypothetical protein